MYENFWTRVRLIKCFSLFIPFCAASQTVMPKKLAKCFGLVNTMQATNHLLLRDRSPRDCDSYGYILLLATDCVSILRGQTSTGPRFGCVHEACKEDLPVDACKVDRPKLLLAQAKVRELSIQSKKKKPTVMGYQGKTPFSKARQLRAPILSNY